MKEAASSSFTWQRATSGTHHKWPPQDQSAVSAKSACALATLSLQAEHGRAADLPVEPSCRLAGTAGPCCGVAVFGKR